MIKCLIPSSFKYLHDFILTDSDCDYEIGEQQINQEQPMSLNLLHTLKVHVRCYQKKNTSGYQCLSGFFLLSSVGRKSLKFLACSHKQSLHY